MDSEGFTSGSLPREMATLGPVPLVWPAEAHKGSSSVCMLFLPDPSDSSRPARVLLIRRSATVKSHRAQIAFPGGRREATDTDPAATALREMEEEVGIERQRVKVLGTINAAHGLDQAPINVVVASCVVRPEELRLAPAEVADVMFPPWTDLTRARAEEFEFTIFGYRRRSYLYRLGPNRVWGLTAGMIFAADLR